MKYALLLGYGLFSTERTDYRKYADNFVSFVNKNKVDFAILCGGHTNPERISESEARTLADYIAPRLKVRCKIKLEDKSLTTGQNIKFSSRFLDTRGKNKIFVFCDNIRPPKIMWFVLHYWFGLSKRSIEDYFIGYTINYYEKGYTTEAIGREIIKGLSYKNVKVIPYRLRKKIDDAVGNQIANVLEINSIYDEGLNRRLIDVVKKHKFHLHSAKAKCKTKV